MSDPDTPDSAVSRPSVFLSYASEDRAAARGLRESLTTLGLDVWYDESELGGGDAWDQKIRRQIRECSYFMPVVSAQTELRHEGYFRREWRLAVERTLDMADDHLFLLPVVIDETNQAVARVPEKFLAVQWVKVPGGRSTPALEALCRRLLAGGTAESPRAAKAAGERRAPSVTAAAAAPDFPVELPGQRLRFWFAIVVWLVKSAWALFQRLPGWIRVLGYIWLSIALISHCSSSSHRRSADVTPAQLDKLKTISNNYQGSQDKNAAAKLGQEIAREFADDDDAAPTTGSPLLAVPFTATAQDGAAGKFADAVFAMTYGRVSISHRGRVGLTQEPLASHDVGAAVERAKANHSTYVLFGAVDKAGGAAALTVQIVRVADGATIWSKSYPVAAADAAKIAAEIDANVPGLDGA